jgi:uncharacterized protein (UPF0332 family)
LDERVKIAFEKFQELLKASELLFDNEFYVDSINRSYYAVFHASNALLMKKEIFTKTHGGIICRFGLEYVVNDNFNKELGKFFHNIEIDREHADYDYSFKSTKNKAKIDLDHAKRFIEECKKFL